MTAIERIRTEILGLSQTEFAAIVGTSQPTVSRWEDGSALPDLEQLGRIRAAVKKARRKWRDSWFWEAAE